jgi:hypothetical protein
LTRPDYSQISVLQALHPEQVISNTSDRDAWRKQLWSLHQQAAEPSLIFQPTSAKEVAIALLVCRQANVKFAVKSGGHAAMRGASSVDGGAVIDLRSLNKIELSEDKSIAKIGAGNKWAQVFEELAKDGLAVAGGRAGDVGVEVTRWVVSHSRSDSHTCFFHWPSLTMSRRHILLRIRSRVGLRQYSQL